MRWIELVQCDAAFEIICNFVWASPGPRSLWGSSRLPISPHLIVRLSIPPRLLVAVVVVGSVKVLI
jgi:hypothetical protein